MEHTVFIDDPIERVPLSARRINNKSFQHGKPFIEEYKKWLLEDWKLPEGKPMKDEQPTITLKASETVGVKYDAGKLRPSLVPIKSLNEVIKVLMFGSLKYSDDNWKIVPGARARYKDAAMRHLHAYMDGEKNDNETGLSHLAHCICCCMFIIWFDLTGLEVKE